MPTSRRVSRTRKVTDPDEYIDDEEEAPKRSRRSRDDDDDDEDEDERPAKRRSRSRDEDEDDEDEEERKPRRRSKSRDEDEDDDDEEDERPRKSSKSKEPEDHKGIHTGWGGAKKVGNTGKSYIKSLNFKEAKEPFLVKFIGDAPFASYNEHWISREGKKSFTCLGDDCPLCDVGDKPSGRVAFNVIQLHEDEAPTHELLILPPGAAEQLNDISSGAKVKPLSNMYYEISRSGSGTKSKYNFYPIKDRDLEEDHNVEELSEAEVKSFTKKAYTLETGVEHTPRRDLKVIANEIAEDED